MKHHRAPARSCAISLFLIAMALPSGATAVEDDPGVWLTFTATDAFSSDGEASRFRYWFDTQARYFDVGTGTNQWLIRPGIGYQLNDDVRVWAGYARYRTRSLGGAVSNENRYWQQLDWSAGRWLGGNVTLRARLEQRDVSTGNDLGVRLRIRANFVRPIWADGTTNLILSLEPMFDLKDTDWGADAGFGQNRTFLGLGWPVNDKVAMEAGYMNQHIERGGREDLNNHLAVVNLRMRF